jgi:hypothetical protein
VSPNKHTAGGNEFGDYLKEQTDLLNNVIVDLRGQDLEKNFLAACKPTPDKENVVGIKKEEEKNKGFSAFCFF